MTVYLDLLMLLNFLIDFLLLVCAERLAGFLPAFRRISLASLLGGIYGGICGRRIKKTCKRNRI